MYRKLSYILLAFPLMAFRHSQGFSNLPEPASLCLAGAGLIAAGLLFRYIYGH